MKTKHNDRAAAIESALAFGILGCIVFAGTIFCTGMLRQMDALPYALAMCLLGTAVGVFLEFRAVQSLHFAQRIKY